MKFTPLNFLSFAAISIIFVSSVSLAANDPFVGDWKLNPARSKLTDVMKVESLGASKYTFNFGGGPEAIVVDGTDQPGHYGTTLSVAVVAPDAWKVIRKKDGRMLLTANWKLSEDGNTLTDNYNAISPNGSTSTVNYAYKRRGGGSGFAGTWVSTSQAMNFAYVLQFRRYEEDGLSIVDSSSQLTRRMKLDGKDYPCVGPSAAIIVASSVRKIDEHTLELKDKKSDGRLYDTQQIRLSPDLRTLTITKNSAGRDEPNILVFERQ